MVLLDDEIISVERPNSSSENGVTIDVSGADKVGPCATILRNMNDYYRICVKIDDPALTTLEKESLDKHLKNPMQSLNIGLQVFVGRELFYEIHAPNFIAGNIWDVGFLNAATAQLMVLNSTSIEQPIDRLWLWEEYQTLYKFFSTKGKSKIKESLGTFSIYFPIRKVSINMGSINWTI